MSCLLWILWFSFQNEKVAIITSDGGDNALMDLFECSGNKLIEKYRTNICNIGRIYRYMFDFRNETNRA